MENYIGKNKILLVVEIQDKKTPAGEMFVEVSFENGTKEIMPKRRLETISSDKEQEDLEIKTLLKHKVSSTIFGVLHEYGLKMSEIDTVLDGVVELINNASEKSYEIVYGCEKSVTPLNLINDILVENHGNKTS